MKILRKQYIVQRAEVVRQVGRGVQGLTSGHYYSELTRLGISHVHDLTLARVGTLVEAYERAELPIDDEAVAYIRQVANDCADTQARNLNEVILEEVRRSGNRAGVVEQLSGTIERAVTGIKARINHQLLELRDEAILDARSARRETDAPQPEAAATVPEPTTRKWTRGEIWTAVGAIAAIIAIFVAILFPEIRRFLHLEKPSVSQPDIPAKPSLPPAVVRKQLQIITAKDIAELRQRNQVTLVHKTESGKTLSEIPPSSFGFALTTSIVEYGRDGRQEVDVNSFRLPNEFEVQKLVDSTVFLVAYVGPETLDRLREGLKQNESVALYANSWKEASNVAAIPLSQLRCIRERELLVDNNRPLNSVSVLDCQSR